MKKEILKKNENFCNKASKNIKKEKINIITHQVFPREKQEGDYIISVIRNPYDLLVSRWKYHNKVTGDSYTFEKWANNFSRETLMRFVESCYENGDITRKIIIDYFIKLENIEEDINHLIKTGILKTNLTREEIKKIVSKKTNTTEHKHYTSYYTNELYEKVYNDSKIIFEMFGYKKEHLL